MKAWGASRSKRCKDYICCKRSWKETDGFPRAYRVKQAFRYGLASMFALCCISLILASVAAWIFEIVLHIQPHVVELWLGITAFLLGMWGMEHVFTVPHAKLSQPSDEESTRRSRHGKNFHESKRPSGVERPSGVVFTAVEKPERHNNTQVERLEAVTEGSSKPLAPEKAVATAAVATATITPPKGKSEKKNPVIREVWAGNFEEEFANMFEVVKTSKYVAIDTEFPGFVLEGRAEVDDPNEVRNYAALRENVNTLKLIQLGLAFADNSGEFGLEGSNCFCWQFNFKFNLYSDMCSQDSIQMLTAANVDWERHRREGISLVQFGDKLNASGMVKMIKRMGMNWISFQGGYDFAFLLKLITLWRMPETLEGFVSDLDEYFTHRCDLKYQLQLPLGLSSLAKRHNVQRHGNPHQAGSDALLTCSCFFKLDRNIRDNCFGPADGGRTHGALYGLVPNTVVSFGRGYNGSRIVRGKREHHNVSHDGSRNYSSGSAHAQHDTGDMWSKRQVVNTLLRLAHDSEKTVASAANKALSLIQENSGDSDVSEHLRDLAMANRIEAAQKQAIHRKMAVGSQRWDPQKIAAVRSFVPNMMQYAMPMANHHYLMQAPFVYDGRYHEAWEMQRQYMPVHPYQWGRR